MRLILARHGETDWNKQRRIQGLSDLELNKTGRIQAEALALALKNERVEAIYSSPLRRARETADAICRHHQVDVVTLDGLRELDAGEVDGLTYEEMGNQYGDFLDKWIEDCTSVGPPGGCTLQDVQDDVWAAVQEITRRQHQYATEGERNERGVVIAVAHFFPILSIMCKVLELDLSECRRMRVDLGSICTLDFNPTRTVIVSLNDTCHLRRGSQ
ncbi:MAG: histidine phosphatase family protein [Dehalococcoidia bacterium]